VSHQHGIEIAFADRIKSSRDGILLLSACHRRPVLCCRLAHAPYETEHLVALTRDRHDRITAILSLCILNYLGPMTLVGFLKHGRVNACTEIPCDWHGGEGAAMNRSEDRKVSDRRRNEFEGFPERWIQLKAQGVS
jgi:hypothetical protein